MNSWNDRTLFLYSYSSLDAQINSLRSDFLNRLRKLYDYQVIDSFDHCSELHQNGGILLILVTTITDLESLYQLKLPDSLVKVVDLGRNINTILTHFVDIVGVLFL